MNFSEALQDLLPLEGGYSNRPLDLGGETNHGITQNEFNLWNDQREVPRSDVKDISDADVSLFYEMEVWDRAGCDQLYFMGKGNCAYILFNLAVQRGFAKAVCMLQSIIGITPQTGHFGPLTYKNCTVADENSLIFSLLTSMQNHYTEEVLEIPAQVANLNGWLNRLDIMASTVGSSWKATRPTQQ